jgi:predicted RNA-binding protein with RPS1 domain
MYYESIIKVVIMMVAFYFIKKMDIPDSYKFLLTVIPSLLLISTSYVIRSIQYAGKNKPITVKRNNDSSDKALIDEYFFEPFAIEIQKDANATLYENESPFWIQSGGYLDISNPNNYIKIDNIKMDTNYSLEFWLRLNNVSNNNIAKFSIGNNILLKIDYDDEYIYINKTDKIKIKSNKWFHLVIMRGKSDTIGNSKGFVYINGIFVGYVNNLPNLQEIDNTFLFKNIDKPKEYNKNYHDLSNCSLVRFYDRSLTIDELQNNYLKDAYYFSLHEDDMSTTRTYVGGTNLIFYLECRIPTAPINGNNKITNDIVNYKVVKKPVEVMYNISKETKKSCKPKKVSLKKGSDDILVGFVDTSSVSEDWLTKVDKTVKKVSKVTSKRLKISEEKIKLQNNWLDGIPKKTVNKVKDTEKADEESSKDLQGKKQKVKKDKNDGKTSKPIF